MPVEKLTPEVRRVIRDMKDTLHLDGIGLAAIQIGECVRIALITLNPGKKKELTITMINPTITFFSPRMDVMEEGCLSLPKYFGDVERAYEIIVQFRDEKFAPKVFKLQGLNARIVQHEVDHLDGILFADKVIAGTGKQE